MMLADKKILVTGSTGFVGRNLVESLRMRGLEVVTLNDYRGHSLDVRDWQQIKEVEEVGTVYHLAGITSIPYSFENPRETFEVNVAGTLNVLELCRLRKVEKVVFASSYLYGQPQYLPIDEKHPLSPTNPYAVSKALAEDVCRAYHEYYGLKCAILRLFNLYGKGQSDNFLIPSILKQLASRRIELLDSEPRRDFLYITDGVDAFIKAADYSTSDFEVFNIGAGVSYKVSDIVDLAVRLAGVECSIVYRHERKRDEIMDTVADISKAKRLLQWQPQVSFEDGLRDVIA
jgi:UDP-glucose 4-epimerase